MNAFASDWPAAASSDDPAGTGALLTLRLSAIRYVTPAVNAYEFSSLDGAALAPVEPGAHLDLHLPNSMLRQYSLLSQDEDRSRYTIAVKREPAGNGGSRFIHEQLRVGMLVKVSMPRNHFSLAEDAAYSVLIAGGIGITPILSMMQRLRFLGRPFQMHFAAPSAESAPFLRDVLRFSATRFAPSQGQNGQRLDLAAIVAAAPKHAHLYCCGPSAMLSAFADATANWAAEQVHVEHFAPHLEAAEVDGVVLELARSGKRISVGAGQTILEALLDAGIDVPYSCSKGICGACEVGVLAGTPDHRDSVLSAAEQLANNTMMVCCSGCLAGPLKLDL